MNMPEYRRENYFAQRRKGAEGNDLEGGSLCVPAALREK